MGRPRGKVCLCLPSSAVRSLWLLPFHLELPLVFIGTRLHLRRRAVGRGDASRVRERCPVAEGVGWERRGTGEVSTG